VFCGDCIGNSWLFAVILFGSFLAVLQSTMAEDVLIGFVLAGNRVV
jgi:hypothetical protein